MMRIIHKNNMEMLITIDLKNPAFFNSVQVGNYIYLDVKKMIKNQLYYKNGGNGNSHRGSDGTLDISFNEAIFVENKPGVSDLLKSDNGNLSYNDYLNILKLTFIDENRLMFKILHNPSGTNKLILEDKNSYFLKIFEKLWNCFYDLNKILNNGQRFNSKYFKNNIEGPYFVEYTFNNFLNSIKLNNQSGSRNILATDNEFKNVNNSVFFNFNDSINLRKRYIKILNTLNPCKKADERNDQNTMEISINGTSSCIPCDQGSQYAKYSNRFINQITSTSENFVPIYNTNEICKPEYYYIPGQDPKHH